MSVPSVNSIDVVNGIDPAPDLSKKPTVSGQKNVTEGLVYTNEHCIGCNKCIRACSCIGACVSTEPDENGNSRIIVNGSLCVACGACFDVCEHDARDFKDDTERFFSDLKNGEKISLLIAPAFPANYPDLYARILGGLKNLGINRMISVSFGADITTWGYINYIKEHDFTGGISQPCPAVVGYIERYLPELLPKLFPVQSPLMCAATYARKELGITDKLAFISPCIAKKLEIDDPNNHGLVNYNVTFDHLIDLANKNNIFGEPCTDEIEYGLGSIYPMPGGLKENIVWLLGDDVFVRQVEGEKRLYHYLEQNSNRIKDGKTPFLFIDALNCEKGCICGTGTELALSVTDDSLYHLHDIKEKVKKNTADSAWSRAATCEERLDSLNKQFADLKLEDYLRTYTDLSDQYERRIPSKDELNMIFVEMNKKDEESRHINCSCCGYDTCEGMAIAIYNGFNHKDNCVHYLKDMIAMKAAETDSMTGLPNSAGFRSHVNKLKAAGTLTKYNAFYLNLKNFGLVNRRFGKLNADSIIIQYADFWNTFTEADEFVGRLTGDKFIILLRKERSESLFALLEGVETHVTKENQDVPVIIGAVAGCFDIDDNNLDSETILGRCSTALNVAMNKSHVPYVFSTLELHEQVIRRKQLLEIFPIALELGEFMPYYQPKVNTETNTLAGAEALVRWVRDGSVVSPGEFIPILEEDDSICKLDFYIFERVCKDIRKWIDSGIDPVRISTNFSRNNLSSPDFSEHIRNIIDKYEIPREFIEVELTETMSEAEDEKMGKFIRSMQESDIMMAIDDFGTGYSSLNLLRDFPADVLKLDKSFIDKHTNTRRDSVVVANIAKMAKELNMSVITEGVESREQVDFLKGVNINLVQGYFYDKPLAKEAFEERLINKVYN
ncbi:MAG: EAL domain-containing protein [Lachnospiraceae bacterium]|nr:EAL domain-containing protein [Lachnospiraceae bacterium]